MRPGTPKIRIGIIVTFLVMRVTVATPPPDILVALCKEQPKTLTWWTNVIVFTISEVNVICKVVLTN